MRQIDPLVKECLEQEARYGKDWAKRQVGVLTHFLVMMLLLFHIQNGILSWLIEISKGEEHSLRKTAMSILFINFAAIHTTTIVRKSIFSDKDFAHSLRPLHIHYTTWQLVPNMCILCAKKLKQ
jgi:hypothetical protein